MHVRMQLEGRSKAKMSGIHLPWMCRISIVTDTARGLAYLHTADTVPLVHRDVKRWVVCGDGVRSYLAFVCVQC